MCCWVCGLLTCSSVLFTLPIYPPRVRVGCVAYCILYLYATHAVGYSPRVSKGRVCGLLACLGVVVYLIHSVGTGTYIIGIQRRQGAGCVAYWHADATSPHSQFHRFLHCTAKQGNALGLYVFLFIEIQLGSKCLLSAVWPQNTTVHFWANLVMERTLRKVWEKT